MGCLDDPRGRLRRIVPQLSNSGLELSDLIVQVNQDRQNGSGLAAGQILWRDGFQPDQCLFQLTEKVAQGTLSNVLDNGARDRAWQSCFRLQQSREPALRNCVLF